MKTIFFAIMLTALVPFIGAAQKAAANYQHMQATAALLTDPFVQRDYDRFASCAAAVQVEGVKLAGEQTHSIDADPAQCHKPTESGPRWVAVR